jgi:hypothetical protein
MSTFFMWIEGTSIAIAVARSSAVTASLSAVHLLGFTLTMGAALVANLRLLGALFRERRAVEITRPAKRAILVGLCVSGVTGALLFSARAADIAANDAFQWKMLLLIGAAVFHFAVHREAVLDSIGTARARAAGAAGLSLWIGLASAACAFILLE